MEILSGVGFDAVEAHEQSLMRKMIDGVTLCGDSEKIDDRVGVITLTSKVCPTAT